jgi:outer membrane lipoprotein carrier protein
MLRLSKHGVGLFNMLLVALVPGAALAALDAATVVRKVQERYDATRDFTADVTQEMTVASLGKTMVARGTVTFKKPGKMRLELTEGDPQVVVADGNTLWLYQPKEHQVYKAAFDSAFHSTMPISFLTGVGRIAEDFDARLDGAGHDGKLISLLLVPRRDSETIGSLRLFVTRDSYDIVRAEIHDPFGNVSRMHLERVQRNRGLSDDRFIFQVPPGVDVITAPPGQ